MRKRESSAAKRRPKTLRPGEDGHPGGSSYDFDVWLREGLSRCVSVLRVSVRSSTYDALLDTGY